MAVDRVPELDEEKPGANQENSEREDEWEILSDRLSDRQSSLASGSHKGALFVTKCGSVRSITTLECYENASASSVPFKIQRTNSSSTLDSNENSLGPSGKGILGVDYLEHVILPTDTLQGICLAYKISSTRLKQANHFSGSSLLLAPKKLVIPISKQALRSGFIRVQDTDAKEYKLYSFLAEYRELSMTEARAYLELADWNLKEALRSAKEDNEWEREMDGGTLKSGEIRITMNAEGFNARGAGITRLPALGATKEKESGDDSSPPSSPAKKRTPVKPISRSAIPAIASKTVKAEDVVNAADQHNNFGVELKSFSKSD